MLSKVKAPKIESIRHPSGVLRKNVYPPEFINPVRENSPQANEAISKAFSIGMEFCNKSTAGACPERS